MEVEIKTATIEDLKAVQGLSLLQFENELQKFDHTLNREWSFSEDGEEYYKKSINDEDRCVFVAIVGGKTVGFLEGCVSHGNFNRILPKFAELEYMFIMEEYRGMDIGTKLYQTFVDWCKKQDVKRLRTEASVKNAAAIGFYRKNGFVDYDLILETDI